MELILKQSWLKYQKCPCFLSVLSQIWHDIMMRGWARPRLLKFSRKIYLYGPQQVPWGLIRPSTQKCLPTPELKEQPNTQNVIMQCNAWIIFHQNLYVYLPEICPLQTQRPRPSYSRLRLRLSSVHPTYTMINTIELPSYCYIIHTDCYVNVPTTADINKLTQ